MYKYFYIFIFISFQIFAFELTTAEKKWISENKEKELEVLVTKPYNLFLYKKINKDKKYAGIYYKFFKNLEKQIEIKFKFIESESNNVIGKKVETGEADIVINATKTIQKEKKYNFIELPNRFYIGLIGYNTPEYDSELESGTVGIVTNTKEATLFEKRYLPLFMERVYFDDYDEAGKHLQLGNIKYLLGRDVFLENVKDPNLKFLPLNKIRSVENYLAINKKYNYLASIVSKYMSEYEAVNLMDDLKLERVKYYKEILENDEDLQYIKSHYKKIVVEMPNKKRILPLYRKEENEYIGYLPEQMKDLQHITDIPIEMVSSDKKPKYNIRIIDSLFFKDKPEIFIPYYKVKNAIFVKIGSEFLENESQLKNKKEGIVYLREIDPDVKNYKEKTIYKNIKEALNALIRGEIDCLIGDFKLVSIEVSNMHLRNKIKVSGFLEDEIFLGYGLYSKDESLARILKKITPSYYSEYQILSKSLVEEEILDFDYKMIIFLTGISTIIIGTIYLSLLKTKRSMVKMEKLNRNIVSSFEMANYYNDEDTGEHIGRVSTYAEALAKELKCSKKFIEEIKNYASLHDIGKIGVHSTILKKDGKFNEEEFNQMKKHVSIGHEIVKRMNISQVAENIVLYHHEKYNGKGYIFGLTQDEIPLEARIVALADVYDALRQKRSYKPGFSHKEAMNIIIEESGKAFDPKVVEAFLRINELFDGIFKRSKS